MATIDNGFDTLLAIHPQYSGELTCIPTDEVANFKSQDYLSQVITLEYLRRNCFYPIAAATVKNQYRAESWASIWPELIYVRKVCELQYQALLLQIRRGITIPQPGSIALLFQDLRGFADSSIKSFLLDDRFSVSNHDMPQRPGTLKANDQTVPLSAANLELAGSQLRKTTLGITGLRFRIDPSESELLPIHLGVPIIAELARITEAANRAITALHSFKGRSPRTVDYAGAVANVAVMDEIAADVSEFISPDIYFEFWEEMFPARRGFYEIHLPNGFTPIIDTNQLSSADSDGEVKPYGDDFITGLEAYTDSAAAFMTTILLCTSFTQLIDEEYSNTKQPI